MFPAFDVGGVTLFANTEDDALAEAVFGDPRLCGPLLNDGFIQFGRPATGGYDPVCFDTKRMTQHGECPVVQLDHEAALIGERAAVIRELAPSFVSLIEP